MGFPPKIQNASDAAVREALYDMTMAETGNEVLAIKRAREIINFDTKGAGATSSFVRQTVPFMGTAMIGLNNLYRGLVLGQRLTEGERNATRMAIVQGGLQLAAMTVLYTMAVGDDDDYNKLDDQTKNGSFIIPGTGFRIPVPKDGIGFIFKVIPEQLTRLVLAEGAGSEDMGGRVGRAILTGALGVVDFTGFVPVVGSPLAKTGVELTLNRSFFTTNPIVGKSQEGKEPFAQFTEATSDMAKSIGQAFNWSPLKIDYFMKALTGPLGAQTIAMTDALIHAADGKVTPSLKASDYPLWKSFTFSDKDRADLQDFYQFRDHTARIALTYRDFIATGRGKEAIEYMSDPENRRAMALRPFQVKIDGVLSKFRQMRKLVIDDSRITDSQVMRDKLDEIDAQQTKFLKSIQLSKLRAFEGM